MQIPLRSDTTTQGRRMAGARSLWRANGMKEEHFGKPVIAIVNSFTQFVPGHAHLHDIGQYIKGLIEKKEREAIDKVYGLLSHTGGHPYMAEGDQARLLRQLSLVLTQFALLRLEGALK